MTNKEIQEAAEAILNEMRKRKGGFSPAIKEKAQALCAAIQIGYPSDMGRVEK